MASKEARKAAIRKAVRIVNSGNGFVRRATQEDKIKPMTTDIPYSYPWLVNVAEVARRSNENTVRPFYYLGGPMTGYPQFNFPEFFRVGKLLREDGMAIVSPAELDDKAALDAALASPDGKEEKTAGKGWEDYLARDVVIVALPRCEGGIFLPGWEDSKGANLEATVLEALGKAVFALDEQGDDRILRPINDVKRHLTKHEAMKLLERLRSAPPLVRREPPTQEELIDSLGRESKSGHPLDLDTLGRL